MLKIYLAAEDQRVRGGGPRIGRGLFKGGWFENFRQKQKSTFRIKPSEPSRGGP